MYLYEVNINCFNFLLSAVNERRQEGRDGSRRREGEAKERSRARTRNKKAGEAGKRGIKKLKDRLAGDASRYYFVKKKALEEEEEVGSKRGKTRAAESVETAWRITAAREKVRCWGKRGSEILIKQPLDST